MTIEKLLGMDGKSLEALTDNELLEYFKPYLHVTRPESTVARFSDTSKSSGGGAKSNVDKAISKMTPESAARLKELAKQMGLDLNKLNGRS